MRKIHLNLQIADMSVNFISILLHCNIILILFKINNITASIGRHQNKKYSSENQSIWKIT